jgi:glycosyltransferase involved in cell wall biosynthesis
MRATSPHILLHVFSTFGVGGPQVRFSQLATAFGRKYRHIVAAMDGNYDCRFRIPDDLGVRYLESFPAGEGVLSRVLNFRGCIRGLRPDLLVTYNWGAIEWAMANMLPIARHIHVEDGFGPEERTVRLRRRSLARQFLLRSSIVVVPSQKLRRIAVEEWGLRPGQVQYIPNGIDADRLCAQMLNGRTETWCGVGPIIGTVAGLRPEKNIERLLRAFRLVASAHPCRLMIVGDGPERGRLEALSIELGLAHRIRFAGHLEVPASAFRGFDLFALSSDTEQMPLSVLEAMAAGLSIVATDVGDIAEMVAPSNRKFVGARNEIELAEALKALLFDVNERARIGGENRDRARKLFRQDAMIDSYARLFDA